MNYIIGKILNKFTSMEFHLIRRLFDDKQIVNPINPEEVFTCKDLVDGKHYPSSPLIISHPCSL